MTFLNNFLKKSLFISLMLLAFNSRCHAGFSFCNFLWGEVVRQAVGEIEWNVDLSGQTQPTCQGIVPSCWSNAGVGALSAELRAQGVIGKTDELSADYYYAKFLEKELKLGRSPNELTAKGATIEDLIELMNSYGIVLSVEYKFPSVRGKTIRDIGFKDMRPEVLKEKYLKTGKVTPHPLALPLPAMGTYDLRLKDKNVKEALDHIQQELDDGRPVYTTWGPSLNGLSELDGKSLDMRMPKLMAEILKLEDHAMQITAYHLDTTKNIDYLLLKDSSVKTYSVIDRRFVKKYLNEVKFKLK